MSDIERVIKVIEWLIFEGIAKNRREIASVMGYTESSFSQIVNSKVPLSDKFIKKLSVISGDINEDWIKTGNGDMLLSNSITQGDNSINNSGIMGNTHIGSGNSVNVSLPDKGYQKIIKPDGTIEIASINSSMSEGASPEDSSVVKNLQDQIQYLQDLIKSYKDIIEEQKGIIQLLKENRK